MGFPEGCRTAAPPRRIVKGLDLGFGAAEAGVREGDEVTQKYSCFYDVENWEKRFGMVVKREEGGLVELSWWARAWGKMESYQFVAK